MAQIKAMYGTLAMNVVNGHRAKVCLPGIGDPDTLDYLSRLIGYGEFGRESVTRGRLGEQSSTTESTEQLPLAPLEFLRQLPRGEAVLLYGNKPPIRMRLRPWWTDQVLRARGSAN
jgi:type IV secretory pathway TraG/TraD family ATPase VirD4